MRIFRISRTQPYGMRAILNGARRYCIALALASAFMFSPLALLTRADVFTGPGVYWIRSRSSDKALDIDLRGLHGREDGLNLIQWGYHGGSNQQFLIAGTCGPYYTIRARHSDKLLDVRGGSVDGAELQQFRENGGDNQQFSIVLESGDFYRIEAKNSGGLVLDARGGDGGQIILATYHVGRDSQLFSFKKIE